MEYYEVIAGRIFQLCKERGLSINKLAKMSDMRQSTLDNIVKGGSKNPGVKTLHKIAYAFSMTVSEFFDFPEMDAVTFENEGTDEEAERDCYNHIS